MLVPSMAPNSWAEFPAGNQEYRDARLRCALACQNYNRQPENSTAEHRAALYHAIINSNSCPAEPSYDQSQVVHGLVPTTPDPGSFPKHCSSTASSASSARSVAVPTPASSLSPFVSISDPGRGSAPDAAPVDPGRTSGKSPAHATASTAPSDSFPTPPRRFPGQGLAPYIKPPLYVDYGARLEIGTSTFINRNCTILDTPVRRVFIGNNGLIGPNFSIYAVKHPIEYEKRCIPGGVPSYGQDVTIGDDVWIGGNVTVFGGVSIGRGCVIGAHSLVTKDIPAYHLAYGTPARVIRRISKQPVGEQCAAVDADQALPWEWLTSASSRSSSRVAIDLFAHRRVRIGRFELLATDLLVSGLLLCVIGLLWSHMGSF